MKMKRPFAREVTLLKADPSQIDLASGEGSQITTGVLICSHITPMVAKTGDEC